MNCGGEVGRRRGKTFQLSRFFDRGRFQPGTRKTNRHTVLYLAWFPLPPPMARYQEQETAIGGWTDVSLPSTPFPSPHPVTTGGGPAGGGGPHSWVDSGNEVRVLVWPGRDMDAGGRSVDDGDDDDELQADERADEERVPLTTAGRGRGPGRGGRRSLPVPLFKANFPPPISGRGRGQPTHPALSNVPAEKRVSGRAAAISHG